MFNERLRRISKLKSPTLEEFYKRWKILLWKALLMRRHSMILTILELTIPIVLCLQIRWIFEPMALHVQDLETYTKNDILTKFINNTECWYAPQNSFTNDLISRASRLLNVKIQPADSEVSLVLSHYNKSHSSKVTKSLWAIFDMEGDTSSRPKTLSYKIRSSVLGESKMILMYDEEPSVKDPYITSGFMALQTAIENSFVDMWKNTDLMPIGQNLTVARYPFYNIDFVVMPSVIRPNINMIYYMTAAAFLLLPMSTLHKAVHDKETGFRGLMRMMDMSFAVMYVGWLNYLMVTAIPVSIVCTILLYPIFTNAYIPTIFFFIIMYIILSSLVLFTFGTFFRSSMKSILISLSFWLFLTHFTIVLDQFLVTASLTWRIVSLILPQSGLLYGIVTFTSGTDIEKYLSESLKLFLTSNKLPPTEVPTLKVWPNKIIDVFTLNGGYEITHIKEKVTLNMILTAWTIHVVFWYLLAIYLDIINPGEYWSAEPWYFLCKRGKRKQTTVEFKSMGSTNWSAVERTPSFIKPSILVRCVSKKFGMLGSRFTALNDITIDFYRNEFNVILGHNGSGKSTLLKLITGVYNLTKGHVYVEGRDFQEDPTSVRNLFGYCPQEDILVNYMTAMEHLYMCGMMKGMSYKKAHADALELLKTLGLEFVRNKKVKELSAGMKRCISLGMALIGSSHILILDEPTHGIDTEDRKHIWDLLSDLKRKKTIILATNSMEAADFLADRIAIIANGTLACYGSKMYLNRRYGIGYVLSLAVQENYDINLLQMEIQEFSSELITLRSITGLLIRFDVPKQSRFTKLLQHLESNKERLKIVSVTLNAAGIEGQFVRIGLASQFKERGVVYPAKQYELIVQRRRRDLLQNAKRWKRLSGKALRRQQIGAMFYKKFIHVTASWKLYLLSIILAIITLILAMMIGELSKITIFQTTERILNLADYVDSHFHVLYHAADSVIAKNFLVTLYNTGRSYSQKGIYHVSRNISAADIMIHPELHSIEFRDRCVMSVDIDVNGAIHLMYSSTIVHSGPIAMNLLNNALLRHYTHSDQLSIKLKSHPLVDPQKWQHQFVHPRSVRNWENAAVIATLFLVLPTIDLGLKELNSLSKLMQMNTTGVTTLMYWIPIYIIDLSIYILSILFLAVLFAITYKDRFFFLGANFGEVLYVFLWYGACAIPFNYCMQLLTRKPEKVYLIFILTNVFVILLLNGSMVLPTLFRPLGETGRYIFEVALHVIPPYVLTCSLSNYLILSLYNVQCKYVNTCGTEFGIEDPCCQNCGEKYCYKPLNPLMARQSGQDYYHSVIDDLLIMTSLTVAFNLILQVFEVKNRRKWYSPSSIVVEEDEMLSSSVIKEKNQVKEHMRFYKDTKTLPRNVVLAVQNLRKVRGGTEVVRGVNFNIYQQDCFGLLGLNETGKSMIFKMLIGEYSMTAGKAVLYNYEFTKHQDLFIGMIGYCPQINGLNDFMTGRQHLILLAALRGVPLENIFDEVNKWFDVLDLLDFENLKIKVCPWGVRRKISILQSLIGDLPVVFMDEPSAGIDVIAKHAVCDMLHQLREMGTSMLITTHNMQEAEALCLRIGVLTDGQFVVINTCENLKRKHSNYFIMSISVMPALEDKNLLMIKNILEQEFPGIKLKDFHLGILQYELQSQIPYGNVFEILERLRSKYPWITDFTIYRSSMDQVFLELATKSQMSVRRKSLWQKNIEWLERIQRKTRPIVDDMV